MKLPEPGFASSCFPRVRLKLSGAAGGYGQKRQRAVATDTFYCASILRFVSVLVPCLAVKTGAADPALNWRELPSLPDRIGFAGTFAGVSGGALLVGGGANFPDAMPWDGGKKVWYDSVYVLPRLDGHWTAGFKLPRALAYGISVSTKNGVICAGGADAEQHFSDVFRLSWRNSAIEMERLPSLPRAVANACGALVGSTLYMAGGIEKPDATNCLKTFWELDLSASRPQWRELASWPGPARMLAAAGADGDTFFLFSGAELSADPHGKPARRYLKDAYAFKRKTGWRRLADLPRPAVAAPSPAIRFNQKLLIVSGDDGALVNFEPKAAHPGFPKDILAYDIHSDQWTRLGNAPFSRATAPVIQWNKMAVIPNGEPRPGRRTPEVWALQLP
jgi:N-acetylneuraminic acid mutarotase